MSCGAAHDCLEIMSATSPHAPPKEGPAEPTSVTAEDKVDPPSKDLPGAQAAQATMTGEVESGGQASSKPDSLRSEETSNRSGCRNFLLSKSSSQPQALRERIAIDVHDEESFVKKWSYLGPTLTSIASIVLTMVVWVSAWKLNEQQIELQRRQTQLQEEQIKTELADIRSKFFNDLTSADENKKTLAEIGLAGHGLKAMPVVHLALGVEQEDIRQSAVDVFYTLFLAEMTLPGRQQLLGQLENEFQSPNKFLHVGVVKSLVKVEPVMNSVERQQVIKFFWERIPPQNKCSEPEGREVVLEAAKFLNARDVNAMPYLLTIADSPKCGDGWLQAMLTLNASVVDMSEAQRAEVVERIKQVRSEVSRSLREQVSEEDLAKGTGFKAFKQGTELKISFLEFRRKVKAELNDLIQQLSAQKR